MTFYQWFSDSGCLVVVYAIAGSLALVGLGVTMKAILDAIAEAFNNFRD